MNHIRKNYALKSTYDDENKCINDTLSVALFVHLHWLLGSFLLKRDACLYCANIEGLSKHVKDIIKILYTQGVHGDEVALNNILSKRLPMV